MNLGPLSPRQSYFHSWQRELRERAWNTAGEQRVRGKKLGGQVKAALWGEGKWRH